MSPVFAHGQLRLYLLSALADGPRHGYEIIRDLEQRFNGLYSPSAGTIYPRLARLEEEGLVVREEAGRKAVYRITDAGRAEVAGRRTEVQDLEVDLARTIRRMAEEVRAQVRGRSKDLRAELVAAAREARRHARAQPADGRATTSGRGSTQAEVVAEELRRRVRGLTRSADVRPEVLTAVCAILERARAEVLDVVERAGRRAP